MKASEQNRPVFFNSDHPSRQRPLVLVTDDQEDTRLLFRTILGIHGCSVIEAADGEEAVLRAQNSCPYLILMDGTLPQLDGLGATRRIRESGNGRHTPIVFICGRAEPDFRDVAFDAGCDEFLVKLRKHLGVSTANSAV